MTAWGFRRTRADRHLRRPLALLLLLVLAAGTACGDDGGGVEETGGDPAGKPEAPSAPGAGAPDATATTGDVETFDVTAIDGCEAEAGRTVCAHVDHPVDYPHLPPVGGPHTAQLQDCLFYDRPVFIEGAVHSLEHGAVWITYRPDLPGEQISIIEQMAAPDKVLASPWDPADGELPAPVVLSAWGVQLRLDALPDEAAIRFITDYIDNPENAPEPGATCQGGYAQPRP